MYGQHSKFYSVIGGSSDAAFSVITALLFSSYQVHTQIKEGAEAMTPLPRTWTPTSSREAI